jgi:pimeloyl-ACP methyl ester carboxylesterase
MNRDLELTFQICDVWGAKEADPIENQPVTSDIPTLVLSGEFDPVTPPAWGKQVVESLDNAFYVEFPNLGHFVFAERRCARDIVTDFLSDTTTAPDSNCTKFITLNFIPF